MTKSNKYELSPKSNICWRSHMINHEYVLPADVYIEMTAVAVNQWYGIEKLTLCNINFVQPLKTKGIEDTFEIELIADDLPDKIQISVLFAANDQNNLLFTVDVMKSHALMDDLIHGDNIINESFESLDIDFNQDGRYLGEFYHSIKQFSVSENNAYAQLAISENAQQFEDRFLTSPALINAIFIASIYASAHRSGSIHNISVPVSIGEFKILNNINSSDNYQLSLRLKSNDHKKYCYDAVLTDSKNIAIVVIKSLVLIAVNYESPQLQTDKIAVIGVSGKFPDAENIQEFWANLLRGHCSVQQTTNGRWRWEDCFHTGEAMPRKSYCQSGAFLTDIDLFAADFFKIPGIEAKQIDPQQRLFLETSWRALEDAGYAHIGISGKSCGVFVGSSPGDYINLIPKKDRIAQSFWGNSAATIPARIAYYLNLRGPALSVDTACSSSLLAIHLACQSLRAGECEMAIAGGVFVMTTPEFFIQAANANMLSERGLCQTFAADADGFVPGEAVAAVILKPLSKALADGDQIYAIIAGTGVNQDGRSNGLTAPNQEAQTCLIKNVYQKNKIDPQQITLVEAHGTGTRLGDPIEFDGLMEVYNTDISRKNHCAIGSVKTNIGHTALAAGITGFIKIVLALKYKKIPPSLHLNTINPHIELEDSPFYVPLVEKDWETDQIPRMAAVSAFGFSGTNVHIVLQEPVDTNIEESQQSYYLLPVSAENSSILQRYFRDTLEWIENERIVDLAHVEYTLAVRREHHEFRCLFKVKSTTEWQESLRNMMMGVEDERCITFDRIELLTQEDKLYQNYLNGDTVDFSSHYFDKHTKVVSLPPYPLEKKSFWIDKNENDGIIQSIDVNEYFIRDHIVNDHKTMPAVGYIHILSKAIARRYSLALESITLKHILYHQPLYFIHDQYEIIINFKIEAERYQFEMTIDDTIYCSGKFELASKQVPKKINQIKNDLIQTIAPDELYNAFSAVGLRYGNKMRPVQWIKRDNDLAFGYVHLQMHADEEIYPALLDGALQVLGAFVLDLSGKKRNDPHLPFMIEDIQFYQTLSNQCYVQVRKLDTFIFEISIWNECNELCVAFNQVTARPVLKKLEHDWGLFSESWHPMNVDTTHIKRNFGAVLVFLSEDITVEMMSAAFLVNNCSVNQLILIRQGNGFKKCSANEYIINPLLENDYVRLLDHIDNKVITAIQLQSFFVVPSAQLYQAILFSKVCANKLINSLRLVNVFSSAGVNSSYGMMLEGFINCLKKELPDYLVQTIGIEMNDNWLATIIMELMCHPISTAINYIDGKRHIKLITSLQQAGEIHATEKYLITHANYIITGGLGEIGKQIAEFLTRTYKARVLLIGRRMPSIDDKNWLKSANLNSVVEYVVCDVDDFKRLNLLFEDFHARYGKIDGIFHAAGVIRDKLIQNITAADITYGLQAKVVGCTNLAELADKFHIKSIILFSSLSAVFGNDGQAVYASANAFLPHFARQQNERFTSTRWLSIAWPYWENGGMNPAQSNIDQLVDKWDLEPLSTSIALRLLEDALTQSNNVIYVAKHSTSFEPVKAKKVNIVHEDYEEFLLQLFADELQISRDKIKANLTFDKLGLDSLLIVQLTRSLEKHFDKLPTTLLFEFQTIQSLAQYFTKKYPVIRAHEPIGEINDDAIAVIGMFGSYPQAGDLNAFWENLSNSKDCITQPPDGRWEHTPYSWGGFLQDISGFDPLFFNITPRDAEIMDPQERLFLEVAWGAIEDAGYTRSQLSKYNLGIYVGVMYGLYQLYGVEAVNEAQPVIANSSYASIPNRLSYFLDARGPSIAFDTMCSSSLTALHAACQSIRTGECEMALVGGVNIVSHPYKYAELMQKNMLAKDGRCRSFGEDGSGYVPGEGVGALLLKPLKSALRDNDNIHAVLLGSALGHDGHTHGYTVPNPLAQSDTINRAITAAKIDPRTVSYIEAHGTGTVLGDPIEIRGLQQAFLSYTQDKQFCAIGSVKSNIGHLEAAAGVAGVTKAILQLKNKTLVPTLHSTKPNSNIEWKDTAFYLQNNLQEWKQPVIDGKTTTRRAGVSSFGAGGANAHVIIEEAPIKNKVSTNRKSSYLIVLSARSEQALRARVMTMLNWVTQHLRDDDALNDVSYTLLMGREHFEHRFAVSISSLDELILKMQTWLQNDKINNISEVNGEYELERLRFANTDGYPAVLNNLACYYSSGYDLDWSHLFKENESHKISLPTYPFQHKPYWITKREKQQSIPAYVYEKNWYLSENNSFTQHRISDACYLVILDEINQDHIINALSTFVCSQDQIVYLIKNHNNDDWKIMHSGLVEDVSTDRESYIYAYLSSLNYPLKAVFDFVDWCDKADEFIEFRYHIWQKFVSEYQQQSIYWFHFTIGLHSGNMVSGAIFASFTKSIAIEHHKIIAKHIDIETPECLDLSYLIQYEMQNDLDNLEVRYAGNERYLAKLEHSILPQSEDRASFKASNIYIVTGGTRGLGAEVAKYLVNKGVKHLLLTGIEQLPAHNHWDQALNSETISSGVKEKIHFIRELEAQSCQVDLYFGSLSAENELKAHIDRYTQLGIQIKGWVHCAGATAIKPQSFIHKPVQRTKEILEPKVSGLQTLHRLLQEHALDFVMLFSSVSALVPNLSLGMSDYSAANAFMDAFGRFKKQKSMTQYHVIQWPLWSKNDTRVSGVYEHSGLQTLDVKEGITLLEGILRSSKSVQGMVVPKQQQLHDDILLRNHNQRTKQIRIEPRTKIKDDSNSLVSLIRNSLHTVTKLDMHDMHNERKFIDYGVDSVVILELINLIEKELNIILPPTIILEHDSISLLAQYLSSQIHEVKVSEQKQVNVTHIKDDIAVIGLALNFPGASNAKQYWDNLIYKTCSINTPSEDRLKLDSSLVGKSAGFIEQIGHFDAGYFNFNENMALQLDPLCRQFLQISAEAIADSGYTIPELSGRPIGVFVGARSANYVDKLKKWGKTTIVGTGQNFIAAHLAHFANLKGPAMVIDTACSSSIVSLHLAFQSLLNGEVEMAIAGGIDLLIDRRPFEFLSAAMALSPTAHCRPFDRHADGLVPGEGGGVVILKRLTQAIENGDRIYAVIKGSAVNNDGQTMGHTTPNPKSQTDVILQAWQRGGIDPESLAYIETHGTGTAIGDPIELQALTAAFREHSQKTGFCAVGSVKANIGHLLSAAGIASFIKAVLSLHHRMLPPVINCDNPNPRFQFQQSPLYLNLDFIPLEDKVGPIYAGVSSFGFGGTNAHIVLGSFNQQDFPSYQIKRHTQSPPIFNKTLYWPVEDTRQDNVMDAFFNLKKVGAA